MTRKNPKRSGGPRSPEGKAVVAQNATKLGTYSALPVLPSENPEEFNQLVDHFNHDFQPADTIETALVRDLAVLTWKKLRLEKLENEYFINKSNAPIALEEFIDTGLKFNKDRYDFWIADQRFKDSDLKNVRDTLALIKPNLRVGISEDQLAEVKKLNPMIYDSMFNYYRQLDPLAEADISDWELVNKTVRLANQPERFLTSVVFEQYVAYYEAVLWCTKYQSEIEQAILQIKQERILKIMQSDSTRRANDDLSRSLVRTLSEYRKHYQWRMQNRVVDANEV